MSCVPVLMQYCNVLFSLQDHCISFNLSISLEIYYQYLYCVVHCTSNVSSKRAAGFQTDATCIKHTCLDQACKYIV